MNRKPSVVLFRDGANDDRYRAAFEEAGYQARCIPVLTFEYVNGDKLAARLAHSAEYDGLILTSARAVAAIRRTSVSLHPWTDKATFAVGPETSTRAAELGLKVHEADAGSAAALLKIITTAEHIRPLLFPCGNRRRDELPRGLHGAGIPFEELVVYETHPAAPPAIGPETLPEWVAFFSPSGVEAIADADLLTAVRIAAIGSTTADALWSHGYYPDAVAQYPEPGSLVDAVLSAEPP